MKPVKPLRFYEAFTKEERDAMPEDERRRLSSIYRAKYQEYIDKYVDIYTRKDFRRERCWVLLCRHKTNGKIVGEIENSFSMGWSSTHVRVIRPYIARDLKPRFSKADYNKACSDYIQGYQNRVNELNAKCSNDREFFIARVGSKNCPISIDWDSFYRAMPRSKFDYRNLKFKMK